MDGVDQLLGGLHVALSGGSGYSRTCSSKTLGYQPVDRATRRGDPLKEVRATRLTGRRPPDGFDLPTQPPLGAVEAETQYAVEIRCSGPEKAHVRTLLLQAASGAALGLRRLTSENLEDSPRVTVSALPVSASRHDAALEQIVGRMSLEPYVTAVHWQAEQAAAES